MLSIASEFKLNSKEEALLMEPAIPERISEIEVYGVYVLRKKKLWRSDLMEEYMVNLAAIKKALLTLWSIGLI